MSIVTHRPICFWSVMDVEAWMRRWMPKFWTKYQQIFLRNNVTGRVLVEITEVRLAELGIDDYDDRQELLYEILKQKLRSDQEELTNRASSSRF